MTAELPPARVVRDGGEPRVTSGAVPDHVLRLAPRRLPLRLVWRLWFGSKIALFGWLFAGFGMVFTLAFLPQAEVLTPSYDRTTTATITRVETTSMEENDSAIFRIHYTFHDEDGVLRSGASYSKSALNGEHEVHYVSGDPYESRLAGTRSRPFGWWAALVLIFPIVGLAMAIPQLRAGRLASRLLRLGVETRGKLIKSAPTGTSVNDVPVMGLTFEYEVGGRSYQTMVKTLTPEVLQDDALESMLYDPYAPGRATTLDHLPGSPKVTADGEIASRPGIGVHVLIMPIVTVALIIATVAVLAMR